ncbi:MAG: hypothetical protein P8Z70_06900 [Desulfuromonadales bacterium]
MLGVLFVAAIHYPGTVHAEEPVDKGWAEFYSKATAYLTKQQDAASVVAHVLIVGSIADKPGTWLWSWADSSVPESMREPIFQVRQFGEDHGFDELTNPGWPGDKRDGWDMTAAAALILSAKGAYRAPYEGGAVFLIFTDIHRVE